MKKIYLIEGVSGAGKTTVGEKLAELGYQVIDGDEELADFVDPETGLLTEDHNYKNWLWDEKKFYKAVDQAADGIIFICGGAMNKPDFLHNFTKVFTLHLDERTLRHRLATRTNNEYGKKPEELEYQLRMNRVAEQHSKDQGTVLIDATQPLSVVIETILKGVK